jgi:hypothetical protein
LYAEIVTCIKRRNNKNVTHNPRKGICQHALPTAFSRKKNRFYMACCKMPLLALMQPYAGLLESHMSLNIILL